MTSPGDLREVRLLQLPVQVWAAAQAHHDELMREFALLTAGQTDGDIETAPVPRRLLTLVRSLTARFAGSTDAQRRQLFEAAAQGQEVMDELAYTLPLAAGPACVELTQLLDAADDYCRAGRHLLTLATPDESRLFRDWYLGQMRTQLAGEAPVPWPEHLARVRGGS